ncbi:MAG: hypothetical protein EOM48_12330 [Bacilli bacterium]|nr:hypothetical protein [Bacilli bacterium]
MSWDNWYSPIFIFVTRFRSFRYCSKAARSVMSPALTRLSMTTDIGCPEVMTNVTGVPIAVRTADCLPVLIHDPKKKVIAATLIREPLDKS